MDIKAVLLSHAIYLATVVRWVLPWWSTSTTLSWCLHIVYTCFSMWGVLACLSSQELRNKKNTDFFKFEMSICILNCSLNLPSSSTASRELLSQFSTRSGWRWLEVGVRWKKQIVVIAVPWNFRSKTPKCRKWSHSSELQNDVWMHPEASKHPCRICTQDEMLRIYNWYPSIIVTLLLSFHI